MWACKLAKCGGVRVGEHEDMALNPGSVNKDLHVNRWVKMASNKTDIQPLGVFHFSCMLPQIEMALNMNIIYLLTSLACNSGVRMFTKSCKLVSKFRFWQSIDQRSTGYDSTNITARSTHPWFLNIMLNMRKYVKNIISIYEYIYNICYYSFNVHLCVCNWSTSATTEYMHSKQHIFRLWVLLRPPAPWLASSGEPPKTHEMFRGPDWG